MKRQSSSDFTEQVVNAIASVVGSGPASLHAPSFTGNELRYLEECIESTYVSSVGNFVEKFERNLAEYTGADYAICVVNGTSALHLALILAGVEPHDEVLIPTLTFVATANAVRYCNATPHFVDSSDIDLGIDVEKLRDYLKKNTQQINGNCVNLTSERIIRGIVPMHTFGHASDLHGLAKLCLEFNLVMVEDAAESIGTLYRGKHTGLFGKMGILSFNGNKTITTGGGGAILTNDSRIAERAKHLSSTAKLSHAWEYVHDQVGYNYRMPNLNAALGCAQLEELPEKLLKKRELFKKYSVSFENLHGIRMYEEPPHSTSNYWLQAAILEPSHVDFQHEILLRSNQMNIGTRPPWKLIHTLKPYEDCPRMDLTKAKELQARIINIPSSPDLVGLS